MKPDTSPTPTAPDPALQPLSAGEFDELQATLDAWRLQAPTTPRWEFCEGFMAALICCRRQMAPAEYLPLLLPAFVGHTPTQVPAADTSPGQALTDRSIDRFLALWTRRWNLVTQALDTKVVALDDPAAYQPEVVDARALATDGTPAPSFGQPWARGFMAAVAAWPEEWAGPRNKVATQWRTAALECIEALAHDDTHAPTQSAFAGGEEDEDGPFTVSRQRMDTFADALWAVYNMRDMWRILGPRVTPSHKVATPGRNEPCTCGSGKKYKKCCISLSIA